MKVLSIGMDKDLLKEGTPAYLRHIEYAKKVEEYHAVVFARKEYGVEKVEIAKNAWSYPTNSKNTIGLFKDAFKIARKLLKQKGDWVITAQDPFESGVVAYLLSKTTKKPFLIQEHGDFFSQTYWRNESITNRLRFFVGLWLVRRADHVRVVSKRIKKTLIDVGVKENKITVTPVYTDIDEFINAEPDESLSSLRPKDGVLIITIGRFVSQKNLSMMIRAFIKVLEKGINARLVLMGKGEEGEELHKLADEAPDGSIVFKDWTDDPASAIKSADIYALSSNYEGWGRVCIEALATGVPVLMTDTGCANEVVLDGETGLVVPVDDEWAFTEGLYHLLKNKELREKLIRNGNEIIESLPTYEENVRIYAKSLENCLHEK